jgi:Acetyltransferase (GNAT) domain
MRVRAAVQEDGPILTDLRRRSKAYWGYSTDWVRAAEGEVFVPTGSDNAVHRMYVLEMQNLIVGFYSLIRHNIVEIELDDFFVDMPLIGKGFGKMLWLDATRRSIELGHQQLRIIADPNAESFYLKQGATRLSENISRMDPNRILPVLVYDLRALRTR